ncbi:MAG: hypothetical protein ACREA0_32760, partial [bacterium]
LGERYARPEAWASRCMATRRDGDARRRPLARGLVDAGDREGGVKVDVGELCGLGSWPDHHLT